MLRQTSAVCGEEACPKPPHPQADKWSALASSATSSIYGKDRLVENP
jgi:hypothetical protein